MGGKAGTARTKEAAHRQRRARASGRGRRMFRRVGARAALLPPLTPCGHSTGLTDGGGGGRRATRCPAKGTAAELL